MDAYEELRGTGEPGAETVELLRRLAAQVTRTGPFPPPEDYDRWSAAAVDHLVTDLFIAKEGKLVLKCLVRATDQASLERLLITAIENYLKDKAKSTERGKLRRRLVTLLSQDDRFMRAQVGGTDAWSLKAEHQQPWQGDIAELHRAARQVRGVELIGWNESGPTSANNVTALTTVAHAVLACAGGAVRDEDLAKVIQTRFVLLHPVAAVPRQSDGAAEEPRAASADRPDALTVSGTRAEELWDGLTQEERSMLPHLADLGSVAEVLEISLKQAKVRSSALAEKLRLATCDDEQRDDVVLFLLAKCQVRA